MVKFSKMIVLEHALKVILTMMRLSSGEPVNLITPSMSVSMKSGMSASGSWAEGNLIDGSINNQFAEFSAATETWV